MMLLITWGRRWASAACGAARTLGGMAWNEHRKAELTEKIASGERLTRQDGEDLYDSDDLAWLGAQAHA